MGSGLLMLVLVGACAAIVVVGLLLFVRGVRGRRVGMQPHCRKCDFELTGNAALRVFTGTASDVFSGEQQSKCPECGAELLKPDSIRIGAFKRGGYQPQCGIGVVASRYDHADVDAGVAIAQCRSVRRGCALPRDQAS